MCSWNAEPYNLGHPPDRSRPESSQLTASLSSLQDGHGLNGSQLWFRCIHTAPQITNKRLSASSNSLVCRVIRRDLGRLLSFGLSPIPTSARFTARNTLINPATPPKNSTQPTERCIAHFLGSQVLSAIVPNVPEAPALNPFPRSAESP